MKPVLQALLLADHVYQDKSSGKMIIAGTFNRIWFKKAEHKVTEDPVHGTVVKGLVSQMGTPYAYMNLTEVRGELPLTLRYVDLATNAMLIETNFGIRCDDPLQTVEVFLPMPRLPADRAGVFALELLTNDEPLGSVRVVTEELGDTKNEPSAD